MQNRELMDEKTEQLRPENQHLSKTGTLTGTLEGAKRRSRGQISDRGDRRFLVRIFTGVDAAGKREYSSKIVHGTRSQAQQSLTAMLKDIDTKQFIAPEKRLVAEHLRDWLDSTAAMKVSAGTLAGYRAMMKRVIVALGQQRLDKITPAMIQKLYSDMNAEGLSSRTIELTNTILKMALEQAVVWRMIHSNPTAGAERPAKVERGETSAFSGEEINSFLGAAKSSPLYSLWLAFVSTGLRPQEMLALKWTDIEHRIVRVQRDGKYVGVSSTVLNVQRALKHIGGGKYVVGVPKTKKSSRTVSIPASLIDALKVRQQSEAEFSSGYIFCDPLGQPLEIAKIRTKFHALCRAAKVREIRLYDLRHTHATLLLAAGVNLKVVSERLGHSSIVLTADTYSHVLPEIEHETALTVEGLLLSRTAG